MIKKILILLLVPVGLYSLEKKYQDILQDSLQEKLNDFRWNKYLTKEGQKAFFECLSNSSHCKIPTMLDVIIHFWDDSRNNEYEIITEEFEAALHDTINYPELTEKVKENFLSKYLTPEGVKHFCIITKKKEDGTPLVVNGETLQWLRQIYSLLYSVRQKFW